MSRVLRLWQKMISWLRGTKARSDDDTARIAVDYVIKRFPDSKPDRESAHDYVVVRVYDLTRTEAFLVELDSTGKLLSISRRLAGMFEDLSPPP